MLASEARHCSSTLPVSCEDSSEGVVEFSPVIGNSEVSYGFIEYVIIGFAVQEVAGCFGHGELGIILADLFRPSLAPGSILGGETELNDPADDAAVVFNVAGSMEGGTAGGGNIVHYEIDSACLDCAAKLMNGGQAVEMGGIGV